MAIDLGMGIDTAVTPSLHPQTVGSLDEYDDSTSGHLQQVVEAFQLAYEGVGRVHSGRAAALADPTMTEAAQILRTRDAADRVFKDCAARFDRVTANMQSGIKQIETELSQPMQTRTAHPLSVEVRNYLRGMKDAGKSPIDFIRAAIESGDSETVSAALGAPAYLSGLTNEMQAVLLRMAHEKANPVGAKRLRAMKGALELLHNNAPKLHLELEKAIGVPQHKVKAFREAKSRTYKAFAS